MDITVNESSQNDIFVHLTKCNSEFVPELSNSVSLTDYSTKVYKKAMRIEIWHDGVLEGLLAVYINKVDREGYITSVSVLPGSMGRGYGQMLLDFCIKNLKSIGLSKIKLEVKKENMRAINFYNKNKFSLEKSGETSLFLLKDIANE